MKPKKKNPHANAEERKKEAKAKKQRQDKTMHVLGIIALVIVGACFLAVVTDFVVAKVVRSYFGVFASIDHLFNYRRIEDCDVIGEWEPLTGSKAYLVLEKGDTPYVGYYVSYFWDDEAGEYYVRTDAVFSIDKKGHFIVKQEGRSSDVYGYTREADRLVLKHNKKETVFIPKEDK